MHPTLLELPLFGRSLSLDAHGLCIALGAIVGWLLVVRLADRQARPAGALRELGLELMLVGMVGARLASVVLHPSTFASACMVAVESGQNVLWACTRPFWLWEGGLDFEGGLVAALCWLVWRSRRHPLDTLELADRFVPGLALAQSVAHLGCLLAGCCYGRFAGAGPGIRFPAESLAFQQLLERGVLSAYSDSTPPLVPVQVYGAIGAALLCGLLVLALRRGLPSGVVFALYLFGDAVIRLSLAGLRGDLVPYRIGLDAPQLVGIVTLGAAAVVLALSSRARRQRVPGSSTG